MKHIILTFVFLVGGMWALVSQADSWAGSGSGYIEMDDYDYDEDNDFYPPKGESMPDMNDDDDSGDSEDYGNDSNSPWYDFDYDSSPDSDE